MPCRRNVAGRKIGVGDGGVAKARLSRRGRGLDAHPCPGGLQRAKVPGGRPPPVRGYCQGKHSNLVGTTVYAQPRQKQMIQQYTSQTTFVLVLGLRLTFLTRFELK